MTTNPGPLPPEPPDIPGDPDPPDVRLVLLIVFRLLGDLRPYVDDDEGGPQEERDLGLRMGAARAVLARLVKHLEESSP